MPSVAAQETFLSIINTENSCAAKYLLILFNISVLHIRMIFEGLFET